MTESEVILHEIHQAAHPTMLVVAHDPKFLKVLDTSLKLEFECDVLSVTGGRRAVEMAERVKSDLFIIDYYLLDLGALELSHRLHSITELESIPTILLNSCSLLERTPGVPHPIPQHAIRVARVVYRSE